MITFSSMTHRVDTSTILGFFTVLGMVTACILACAALLLLAFLVQEVFRAIAEIIHLVMIGDPMIVTLLSLIVAVYSIRKVKGWMHHA